MSVIAISGASGLVGGALAPHLEARGHTIKKIPRGAYDAEHLRGADVVVHLAGEPIAAGRWSEARKALIRSSRVEGTRALATALAALSPAPKTLISASAIGYYGNLDNVDPVDESAPAGDDFLADVCKQWEAAAEPAAHAGVRVIHARFGIILSPNGGALAKMLPAFRRGAGGRLGSGRQPMSWIAIDDVLSSIDFAITTQSLSGPINIVSPNPVDNAEFTATLARVIKRRAFLPAPAFAIKAIFGEMGRTLLLEGTRVVPRKLLDAGYTFKYPALEGALRHLLEDYDRRPRRL